LNASTTQRKRLDDNIRVGRFCEKVAKNEYESDGWSVINASYGYDFLAVKEISDGVKLTEYVEVKAGDSKLSRLQVATMHKCRREGKTYRVFRVNSNYITAHINKTGNIISSRDENEQLQTPVAASCDNCKKIASRIFGIISKFNLKKFKVSNLQYDSSDDCTKIMLLGGQITRKYCIFLIWGSKK
jgi:hypothetical protein